MENYKSMIRQILSFCCILYGVSYKSQTIVFNDKLLAQVTKNNAVRIASEKSFLNSYEKQQKVYKDVNAKLAQVVAINDYIYKQLRNVNSAISQGKELYYIYKDLGEITKNSQQLLRMSVEKPQYAILINELYGHIIEDAVTLKTEVMEEILREDNDFLMDSYDRTRLIRNISRKVGSIRKMVNHIISRLKRAKNTPYVYQIPVIKNYVIKDKMIIGNIMKKYKWVTKY